MRDISVRDKILSRADLGPQPTFNKCDWSKSL